MDKQTMGDRIRILRATKNISQQELAVAVGATQGTVSAWEANTAPTLPMARRIAGYFGVSLDYLVDGSTGGVDTQGESLKQASERAHR